MFKQWIRAYVSFYTEKYLLYKHFYKIWQPVSIPVSHGVSFNVWTLWNSSFCIRPANHLGIRLIFFFGIFLKDYVNIYN